MRVCAGLVLLFAGLAGRVAAQETDAPLQAVLANGYRFAYAESGTGHPVVLVHGSLTDYRFWDMLRAAGGDSPRLIAYSRRSHAPNPWRPDDPPSGFETSAADLAAIIRALRLERPVLVGHGWGGQVALQAALRFPGLLGGIVLAEPIADSMIADPATRAQFAARARAIDSAALSLDPERNPEAALRVYLAGWHGADFWASLPDADRRQAIENAVTLRSAAARQPPLSCEALRRITVPILLAEGGATDRRFRDALEGIASCVPEAGRIRIGGAGHRFPETHAAPFRRAIEDFVNALPR